MTFRPNPGQSTTGTVEYIIRSADLTAASQFDVQVLNPDKTPNNGFKAEIIGPPTIVIGQPGLSISHVFLKIRVSVPRILVNDEEVAAAPQTPGLYTISVSLSGSTTSIGDIGFYYQ
ncbi:MAG: hypothetical protein ACKOU6_07350 [Planctomycetota bacterium]